jgi:hypothetical protein
MAVMTSTPFAARRRHAARSIALAQPPNWAGVTAVALAPPLSLALWVCLVNGAALITRILG